MHTQYAQPKKLPKGRTVSETKPAPKIKGMAGFAKAGRIGGRVSPGKDRI
jgi:hypothetical protein